MLQQLRHVKILIIDDDEDIRWSLKEIFSTTPRFEFEVFEADNAKEGVKLFQETFPDLVLLDVNLPDVNGIKILQGIVKKYPGTNIVMISGIERERLLKETKFVGAREFICKPFDHRIVLNTLAKVLDKSPTYMDN